MVPNNLPSSTLRKLVKVLLAVVNSSYLLSIISEWGPLARSILSWWINSLRVRNPLLNRSIISSIISRPNIKTKTMSNSLYLTSLNSTNIKDREPSSSPLRATTIAPSRSILQQATIAITHMATTIRPTPTQQNNSNNHRSSMTVSPYLTSQRPLQPIIMPLRFPWTLPLVMK